MNDNPVRIAVIGAGTRGLSLAKNIVSLGNIGEIIAVAEPDSQRRTGFAREFKIDSGLVFTDWHEMASDASAFDAVIITTLDNAHTEPAVAFLERGCHLLIEKPMADSAENCRKILVAQKRANRIIAVCHTLRFMEGFRTVKNLIDQDTIGKVISINQMEEIGNTRFAHNYVRGRWSNDEYNTYLLLHKSCHDLDYIAWLIGDKCRSVSSFGGLSYFKKENAPENHSARCTDNCVCEPQCPYSAIKLYSTDNLHKWPARDVSRVHSPEAHLEAVRTGPYGQCVWNAGNNVVDHQVVAMDFEGGATATFTMSGFTQRKRRLVQVHGTKGEISLDDSINEIRLRSFINRSVDTFKYEAGSDYHPEDREIVDNWLTAVRTNKPDSVEVDGDEAFSKLKIVFAAERSRLEERSVDICEL